MLQSPAARTPRATAHPAEGSGATEPALQELRRLLLAGERARQTALDERLRGLEDRWEPAALAEQLGPALAPALRQQLAQERELVVESLLPMVGDLVQRAVGDAIGDLAAEVDSQIRRSLDGQLLAHRLRAWLGAAGPLAALRLGLPFRVREILLVHQETGLLLCRWQPERAEGPGAVGAADTAAASDTADAEVLSGMLSAIQDFARDAMRAAPGAELGELRLGETRIQRCNGRRAFLAVIAEGEPPVGYRHLLRETLRQFERRHQAALRAFDGRTGAFQGLEPELAPLAAAQTVIPLSRGERWMLRLALVALVALFLAAAHRLGWLDPLLRWAQGLHPPSAKVIPFE